MRRLLLLPLLSLACACAAVRTPAGVGVVDPPLVIPQAPLPETTDHSFNRARIEADLLFSARQRFGEALVRRAIAAPAFLFSKHYPGMLPPPPPDAGPDWKYPEPPAAMLFQENGIWLVATAQGVRQARSDKLSELQAILANLAFWGEPENPEVGCTDSGASLFMLKVPQRPRITRRGVCGGGPNGERLVFVALEA